MLPGALSGVHSVNLDLLTPAAREPLIEGTGRVCSAEPKRIAADLEWQVHWCGRLLRRYGKAER